MVGRGACGAASYLKNWILYDGKYLLEGFVGRSLGGSALHIPHPRSNTRVVAKRTGERGVRDRTRHDRGNV
jgi:hypothetical protein